MGHTDHVQPGTKITITLGADAEPGDVLAYGGGIAIAQTAGLNTEDVEASIEGVYEFTKASALVLAQGDQVGFDTTAKTIVAASGADKFAGIVHKAAGDGETLVQVKINAPIPGSVA